LWGEKRLEELRIFCARGTNFTAGRESRDWHERIQRKGKKLWKPRIPISWADKDTLQGWGPLMVRLSC